MDNRESIWDYWYDPPSKNKPERYTSNHRRDKRSSFLIDIFKEYEISQNNTILELGCNVGRNLLALKRAGYNMLYGIEINPDAVSLMKDEYPEIDAKIRIGTIEDQLQRHRTVHVIFTVAVLMHIHPDSDWIFSKMVERTKHWIITIENEKSRSSSLHVRRNYREIFTSLGMECIDSIYYVPGTNSHYICRVFLKP